MPTYPTVDESFAQLHAAGGSVGEVAVFTPDGRRWLVDGSNGENSLRAESGSQAQAWAAERARALVAGEIEAVLPLDEAELLDAARPITPAGEAEADAAAGRARQGAQVRAPLKAGPPSLLVLGGSHHLSESGPALPQGSGR